MATPSSPTMTSPSRTPTRAAGLSVSTLTTRALELAGGRRGRQNWRFFVSNLSEMAAQHTDQTLAAADGMLERVVADVGKTAPADAADLKAKAGTREMYELLRRRQSDLPQVSVVSILTMDGALKELLALMALMSGSLAVASTPGQGATFRVDLPLARAHSPGLVDANAMAADRDRDRCLAAGMSDHLPEPLSREALVAMVLKWVR